MSVWFFMTDNQTNRHTITDLNHLSNDKFNAHKIMSKNEFIEICCLMKLSNQRGYSDDSEYRLIIDQSVMMADELEKRGIATWVNKENKKS